MPDTSRNCVFIQAAVAILTVALATDAACAQPASGTLYTLSNSNGHVGAFALDPVTGATTLVVETDAGGVSGPVSTFDSVNGQFFFRFLTELYTVNVRQQVYSHVTAIGSSIEFDSVEQQLYTLANSNGHVGVFALNPVTGATTLVVETDAGGVSGPVSTFDSVNGRFFFRFLTELYTVNVRQQVYSHVTAIGSSIEFDSVEQQLYTLANSNGHVGVFALNPVTGATTLVVETDAGGISGPVSTFDVLAGRFFFRFGGELYTVNVRQQTYIHVSAVGSSLEFELSVSIPAFSEPALFLLLLALVASAIYRLR